MKPVMTALLAFAAACAAHAQEGDLSATLTTARSADGQFIAWQEHLIDDEAMSGVELRGSDGLAMADLNGDGFEDIVSVHESDVEYDGVPDGHIRIAFGTLDPHVWNLVTLAVGQEAGAAEDVALGDVNGDGYIDIVAACELAHIIYFENPGENAPLDAHWARVIPSVTTNRGSFIRVFLADLNNDGKPEVITANKGAQDPTKAALEPRPISFFEIDGAPLDDSSWIEHVLTAVPWPINAQPVDLDSDGDIDVVGGSVAQGRIMWFENRGEAGQFEFVEHAIAVDAGSGDKVPIVNGFNMEFADLSGDGKVDIATFDTARLLGINAVWLEQPATAGDAWRLHRIGSYGPDSFVGIALADINGNGRLDLMTGGYSLGSRTADDRTDPAGSLGRLAWFENPGDASQQWPRHDFSRRQRGMFDKFVVRDLDGDGDLDFISTRGNSGAYDGVFWLEQVRSVVPTRAFTGARATDSPEMPLPE